MFLKFGVQINIFLKDMEIKIEHQTYIFYLELRNFSENYDHVIFYPFIKYRKEDNLIKNKSL